MSYRIVGGFVSIGGVVIKTIHQAEVCYQYNIRNSLITDRADPVIIQKYDKWLESGFLTQITTHPLK